MSTTNLNGSSVYDVSTGVSPATTMFFVSAVFKWRRFATIYDTEEAYKSVNDAITQFLTVSTSPGISNLGSKLS